MSQACPAGTENMLQVLSSKSYGEFPRGQSSSLNLNFKTAGQAQGNEGTVTERDRALLSLLAPLLDAFRRSGLTCRASSEEIKMDIGWPTDVRHVAHVTFDRFNGFLGLPVEFQMEIPRRVPSASASVFGVSPESMHCAYDREGNSVPLILLLLQRRLYRDGGLKAEGIFRINAENGQEEHLRDQLNKGIVPNDIDVHCLAGLIKAWFRELPTGVFDTLSPEEVMQCQTEEDCLVLVKKLPSTQAALLNWAVNLMADVVQEEEFNKMNARNIAMVFAPNMTQMSDPLTALMHAVQVMNFLKTLVLKTLRDRKEASLDTCLYASIDPPNDDGARDSLMCTSFSFIDNELFEIEDKNTDNCKERDLGSFNMEKMHLRCYPSDENGADFGSRGPVADGLVSYARNCRSRSGSGTKRVDALKYSLNGDGCERSGNEVSEVCNKTKHRRNGLHRKRREFHKWDVEGNDIAPDVPSFKGKAKDGVAGDKIDMQHEKVEAW